MFKSSQLAPRLTAEKLDSFMKGLIIRNPGETEFHQAVYEVASAIQSEDSRKESRQGSFLML